MSPTRRLWTVSSILAITALAACSGSSTTGSAPAPSPRPTQAGLLGKFDHVIVIDQENRSVDNLFNGFPGADTVRVGKNGAGNVTLKPIALEPSADHDHSYDGFVADYNGGAMNGFGHDKSDTETPYAFVRQQDVQNYWTLASRFTLADETFQVAMVPSFPAHVNLIAAQGGYPLAAVGNPNTKNVRPGCLGNAVTKFVDVRSSFPATEVTAPACVEVQTIFDLLDGKGLSWRYYAPVAGIGINYWSGVDYVKHLALGPDHAKLVGPESLILDDIAGGRLPAVSYVAPEACASDHPHKTPVDPLAGPKWVAAITNAVGASRYWSRTLILITWDDWGGWYDHVPPPILSADQLGFRIPFLIVSAYPARPGAVDHRVRNQASILAAIESIFGLESLGQLDGKTDDLSSDFHFGGTPAAYGAPLPAGIAPPQHCKIPGGGDE